MSYEAIGRRWARAIFEIGKETGAVAAITKDIQAFADVYAGSEELSTVLDNPLVPEAAREAILVEIAGRLGVSEQAKNALRLLAKKRRLVALPDIARQLGRLADEDANVIRAEVTSAGPLSESYLAKLKAELEKATGSKVTLAHRIDKSLIGGVVTKVGDQVVDGSIRARLATFREGLLRA